MTHCLSEWSKGVSCRPGPCHRAAWRPTSNWQHLWFKPLKIFKWNNAAEWRCRTEVNNSNTHCTPDLPQPTHIMGFLGGPPLHKTSVHGFVVVVKINPSPQIIFWSKNVPESGPNTQPCALSYVPKSFNNTPPFWSESLNLTQTCKHSTAHGSTEESDLFFLTSKYLTSIPVM